MMDWLETVGLREVELVKLVGTMGLARFVEIVKFRARLGRTIKRNSSLLGIEVRSISWVFKNWFVRSLSFPKHQFVPFHTVVKFMLLNFLG
jgi:hypothetical protein